MLFFQAATLFRADGTGEGIGFAAANGSETEDETIIEPTCCSYGDSTRAHQSHNAFN